MIKKSLLLAGAMLMTVMAVNAHALSLEISTNGINWQTITDNGSGDLDPNLSSISFASTTVSGYDLVKISSASENTLNNGSLYTNSFEESGAPSIIYVMLSDFPYNVTLPVAGGISTLTGLTIQNAGASATLQTYYGSSLFATTTLISDVSLTAPGYIGQSANIAALSDPFSLTELLTINNSGGDVSSQVTASLEVSPSPVPEPGTLLLLGAGMFFLAICGKRHLNNKEDSIMPATA
jgi:hypothetical protein